MEPHKNLVPQVAETVEGVDLKKFLSSIKDAPRLVLLPADTSKSYAQLRQFEYKNDINIYFFSGNTP